MGRNQNYAGIHWRKGINDWGYEDQTVNDPYISIIDEGNAKKSQGRQTKVYRGDRKIRTAQMAHDGSYMGKFKLCSDMRDCPFCGSRLKVLDCSCCGARFIVTANRSEERLRQACQDGVFLIYRNNA